MKAVKKVIETEVIPMILNTSYNREVFSESSIMPLYLSIQQHSPESCPVNNEKTKKLAIAYFSKQEQLTRKHGVKIVGAWHSMEDHTVAIVFEVKSVEAMQEFMMEPEVLNFMAYQTSHTRLVTTMEEAAKLYLK
jgi:hypothetical protein